MTARPYGNRYLTRSGDRQEPSHAQYLPKPFIRSIVQKLETKMERHLTRDTRRALTRAIKENRKGKLHRSPEGGSHQV
jgi:hypothetical protein